MFQEDKSNFQMQAYNRRYCSRIFAKPRSDKIKTIYTSSSKLTVKPIRKYIKTPIFLSMAQIKLTNCETKSIKASVLQFTTNFAPHSGELPS